MASNLLNRTDLLERDCRWWRRFSLALVFALGAAVLLGQQSSPGVVEAREFRVVGPSGETLASLGHDFRGGVHLMFMDPEGKPRIRLATEIEDAQGLIDGVSSGLWLSGGSEQPGIMLMTGGPYRRLSLCDLQGNPRLSLKVRDFIKNGAATVSLHFEDAQSHELITLAVPALSTERPVDRTGATPEGKTILEKASPELGLLTADGGRIWLKVWGDGQPSIDVWDRDGATVLKVP
ncbi:MAG: hypothetical protein V3T53_15000 [Phycisphaerales bacterium]